jgi:bacillopeptidase F (M6 metalloprotease family)
MCSPSKNKYVSSCSKLKKEIILENLFKIYKTSQFFDLLVVNENYSKKNKTNVISMQF